MAADKLIASTWPWRIYAALLFLIGLVLGGMGGKLLMLGGSPYYVIAGLLTLIAGVLIWRGDDRGALIYAIMLAGTLVWAFWEVGTDPWPLVARLVAPMVLGLPLLGAWLWRRGGGKLLGGAAAALVVIVLAGGFYLSTSEIDGAADATPATIVDANVPAGDWAHFGRDLAGTRFVPFAEINPSNVTKLRIAWEYRAGSRIGEATPLQIGSSLYLCTADNQMIALDAGTGRQLWRYDPHVAASAIGHSCRSVAYHAAVSGATGECAASVYVATRDARLIGVDAATGKPCSQFGQDGTVDLKANMGDDSHGYLYASSPPIVVGDTVILGSCVYDGQQTSEPSGVVRAFDAKTGKLLWAWDIGRPGVNTAPPPGETYTRGTPNVWSVPSADPALGLVYLPTGNATPDYYGGHRKPIMDKYASSVVALDVKTGAVRWAFQTVHHDIWDYDVASQPVLFDFPTPQGKIPAVLQATKRGELFVLDRRTGKPLTAVEERHTPQGAVPGDYTAPTQPFSVGMPSLMDQPLNEAAMWGLTPIDQLWCRIKFREARYEGTMTPIGIKPIVRAPGSSGIYNWGSLSIDEGTGIMVAATLHLANYDRLIPRNSPEARRFDTLDGAGHPEIGPGAGSPQRGTPYAVSNPPFFSPLAVPCTKPPYGRISAIDLKTRKLLWSKPVGTTRDSGPFGIPLRIPLPMGAPVNGGVLVTRSGLSFFAGAQDGYLRAYATQTGAELWRASLPIGTEATPMSYISPKTHRQTIVVTAGGSVGTTESGDYVIAYALPDGETAR